MPLRSRDAEVPSEAPANPTQQQVGRTARPIPRGFVREAGWSGSAGPSAGRAAEAEARREPDRTTPTNLTSSLASQIPGTVWQRRRLPSLVTGQRHKQVGDGGDHCLRTEAVSRCLISRGAACECSLRAGPGAREASLPGPTAAPRSPPEGRR